MPTFGYFWVYCPKYAQRWKSEFATIPEKLPGHLGIPIDHINHIWSNLPSLKRCKRASFLDTLCVGHTLCPLNSVMSVPLSACHAKFSYFPS